MAKRWRQYNGQTMKIIQCRKDEDNTMAKRWRQYNGQKNKRQYNGEKKEDKRTHIVRSINQEIFALYTTYVAFCKIIDYANESITPVTTNAWSLFYPFLRYLFYWFFIRHTEIAMEWKSAVFLLFSCTNVVYGMWTTGNTSSWKALYWSVLFIFERFRKYFPSC